MTLWNLVSTQRIREVKSKGVSTQLKRGGALLAWPLLFYYTFCYLYSQITLKSMINWVEHHNRSIIKNKGWSPFDLTTIILLYFLLPLWSNYIEIPFGLTTIILLYFLLPVLSNYIEIHYECESVKVVKSKGISM